MKQDPAFAPRLLPAPEAAHYLGVSETMLRGLGLPRRVLGAKRLFDRLDLDRYASDLPYEGQADEVAECDRLFGVAR
ncbi:helix-turn-helix domain-containing protein [Xinfangfangia pollutisoli]|uniref:helix-turn-helix domain-containing protein n=1 Tax=Xinfangfangia pollutisoli TaxID=2865960 RepID=UPI001CD2C58B|nr:helix-turn-helix domain-containing protein [Xinfangfangia pollutisoli]